jgi:hypothetical protein
MEELILKFQKTNNKKQISTNKQIQNSKPLALAVFYIFEF